MSVFRLLVPGRLSSRFAGACRRICFAAQTRRICYTHYLRTISPWEISVCSHGNNYSQNRVITIFSATEYWPLRATLRTNGWRSGKTGREDRTGAWVNNKGTNLTAPKRRGRPMWMHRWSSPAAGLSALGTALKPLSTHTVGAMFFSPLSFRTIP